MPSSTRINGASGAVSYNSTEIYITEWEAAVNTTTKDTTDSEDTTWKTKLANGFKEWSGSFSGWVIDGTDTPVVTGDSAAAELVLTAETGVTFTGNAILTGKTINLQINEGDPVRYTMTFEGDGSLTEANAA